MLSCGILHKYSVRKVGCPHCLDGLAPMDLLGEEDSYSQHQVHLLYTASISVPSFGDTQKEAQ